MVFKIKNEDDYQKLLGVIRSKGPDHTSETPLPLLNTSSSDQKKKKTSNKTNKEAVILHSLLNTTIDVECSPQHFTLLFRGARLFTLNEIFVLLQYKSYIIFSYKKKWHQLVQQGLRLAGHDKPLFNGPCKITLFRQGTKQVDRDSLMVMFKYIIDALKHSSKTQQTGIFPDDNPDIVYSDEKIQTIGEPMVGIRVDLIQPTPQPHSFNALSLFDQPPAHSEQLLPGLSKVAKSKKKNKKPLDSNHLVLEKEDEVFTDTLSSSPGASKKRKNKKSDTGSPS